jgi:hypothetical protein
MIDSSKIELFHDDEFVSNDLKLFKTKHKIDDIENIINNILDKYSEICKYYIDIENTYWCVSFNVGLEQLEAFYHTMFIINLYRDINNNSIIVISKEIYEHHQWREIFQELSKKLKNN